MFILIWLFCFDYTFLHFPFIHNFSVIGHVPGTEKFSNIETALHPQKVTLPKGQSLLCHTVAALPVCCHCKMTVLRLWFHQGYPHWTVGLLIAPSTAFGGGNAPGRGVISGFRECHLGEPHGRPDLRKDL